MCRTEADTKLAHRQPQHCGDLLAESRLRGLVLELVNVRQQTQERNGPQAVRLAGVIEVDPVHDAVAVQWRDGVTRKLPLPSALQTQISSDPERSDSNAILCPSSV